MHMRQRVNDDVVYICCIGISGDKNISDEVLSAFITACMHGVEIRKECKISTVENKLKNINILRFAPIRGDKELLAVIVFIAFALCNEGNNTELTDSCTMKYAKKIIDGCVDQMSKINKNSSVHFFGDICMHIETLVDMITN